MVRTRFAYVVILLKGHYDESGVILYLKKKKNEPGNGELL